VKDLAVRLAALDADAGAALQVIAYFDSLVEAKAGLQSIVRGAAVLAGCTARLDDDARHVHVRVDPAGVSALSTQPPEPAWPSTPVSPDGTAMLYLERRDPAGPVDAMVLERASGAARAVLDRTRGRAPAPDPASAELVVDATAPLDVRLRAARRLGLAPDAPARAIALPGGGIAVTAAAPAPAVPRAGAGPPLEIADLPASSARAGVGPAVEIGDLPASFAAARVALRFAAEGTDDDPGATTVHYDQLGGLALLADADTEVAIPDVGALEHAAGSAPWILPTLQAVADSISLRAAAAALRVHHSTLQGRISHAEHALGWPVRDPQGRLRLQLALALRRLHRHR
jgi:hypothetical protein